MKIIMETLRLIVDSHVKKSVASIIPPISDKVLVEDKNLLFPSNPYMNLRPLVG